MADTSKTVEIIFGGVDRTGLLSDQSVAIWKASPETLEISLARWPTSLTALLNWIWHWRPPPWVSPVTR